MHRYQRPHRPEDRRGRRRGGGETLIFTANGFHCPLTAVAQNLGDVHGSVTDIYLPHWFARNLPAIHVPVIVVAVLLHWRIWRNNAGRDSQRRLLLGR
jgi:hypothetical protein